MAIAVNSTASKPLSAGQVLTLVCSANALGSVVRVGDSAGNDPYPPVPIAGANLTFGPYAVNAVLRIHVTAGIVTDTTFLTVQPVTKTAVVVGAAAGNVAVAGLLLTDTLLDVINFVKTGGNLTDVISLKSQFTVNAAGQINNTGGTSTSGNKLLVLWQTPPT